MRGKEPRMIRPDQRCILAVRIGRGSSSQPLTFLRIKDLPLPDTFEQNNTVSKHSSAMKLALSTFISAGLPLLVFGTPISADQHSTTPTRVTSFAPAQWAHPGYVVDKDQLDFVKSQVANKAQPWTNAYSSMLKDSDKYGKYVSGTRTSETVSTVSCGPTTNPDIKCTDERGDALAAWANALAWYVSGDSTYAKNAIGLMNKWSYAIKGKLSHPCTTYVLTIDSGHALSNAILQTAWAGGSWARAGELIRHTTTGFWAAKDITQFESMLRNVYLPVVKDGDTRASNWDVGELFPASAGFESAANKIRSLPQYCHWHCSFSRRQQCV